MIREIIAAVFIIFGILLFAVEIYGVYRFSFVMNRMHAAAIGDTLALSSCMIGLIILAGFSYSSLKFILVVVFLWFSSPVSSHLITHLEVETNEKAGTHYAEEVIKEQEKEEQ